MSLYEKSEEEAKSARAEPQAILNIFKVWRIIIILAIGHLLFRIVNDLGNYFFLSEVNQLESHHTKNLFEGSAGILLLGCIFVFKSEFFSKILIWLQALKIGLIIVREVFYHSGSMLVTEYLLKFEAFIPFPASPISTPESVPSFAQQSFNTLVLYILLIQLITLVLYVVIWQLKRKNI